MPKPGGGGGKPSPFDLSQNGVASVAKDEWVDLGSIGASGQQLQLGLCPFTPIDKMITCEVRTNISGQSGGTVAKTEIKAKAGAKAGSSKTIDMWKRGRLFITTPVSTGVEHWYLRFTSKKTTVSECIWQITYLELN